MMMVYVSLILFSLSFLQTMAVDRSVVSRATTFCGRDDGNNDGNPDNDRCTESKGTGLCLDTNGNLYLFCGDDGYTLGDCQQTAATALDVIGLEYYVNYEDCYLLYDFATPDFVCPDGFTRSTFPDEGTGAIVGADGYAESECFSCAAVV